MAFLSAFYSFSARNEAHSAKFFCVELQALFLSDWHCREFADILAWKDAFSDRVCSFMRNRFSTFCLSF